MDVHVASRIRENSNKVGQNDEIEILLNSRLNEWNDSKAYK